MPAARDLISGANSAAETAAMDKRRFGRTGLDVSLLGFGCGAVGGLMIKGTAADQERAVGRTLELGRRCTATAKASAISGGY
jgi:hypothetical protein